MTFYGSVLHRRSDRRRWSPRPGRDAEAVLVHQFDLDAIAALRASWGLFRDRRPELYRPVGTLDGRGR